MHSKFKIVIFSFNSLALIAIGIWFGLPLVRGVSVTTVSVIRTDILQTIVATGRVETPFLVTLGMACTGSVTSVHVNEGDIVTKGDILVSIDDSDARSALEQAEAVVHQSEAKLAQIGGTGLASAREALAQANATLKNASQNYKRLTGLTIPGSVSKVELDNAKQAYEIAQSQVRIAKEAFASNSPNGNDSLFAQSVLEQSIAAECAAETNLKNTQLLAPADGTIISRSVEVGMVVQPGLGVIQFSPAIDKRLVVLIDERNLSKIKIGLTALASADAYPDERFNAVLAFINPIIDSDRGSFEVKLDVPKPPTYLKEGMTVSLDIEILRKDKVLVIDTNTIRNVTEDKPHVFAIVDGHVVDKPVVIGIQGAGKSEIISGLTEGDLVIPAGINDISVGRKVRTVTAFAK